jgi:hypothetical protein
MHPYDVFESTCQFPFFAQVLELGNRRVAKAQATASVILIDQRDLSVICGIG